MRRVEINWGFGRGWWVLRVGGGDDKRGLREGEIGGVWWW